MTKVDFFQNYKIEYVQILVKTNISNFSQRNSEYMEEEN